MRVGVGFDVHPFTDDASRKLILGGVEIDGRGLQGHSDADVVTHAITDAVLGAAGLGDMGAHFPDTDPKWNGADSLEMLRAAVGLAADVGLRPSNADCTVVLEAPKISPHREEMQTRLAQVLGATVNVKASRAEGLGAIGRVEGVACYAVALLEQA